MATDIPATHHHRPDPGLARATEYLATQFNDNRHLPKRTCLSCGRSSRDMPGSTMCTAKGPQLSTYCTACYEETGNGSRWLHQPSWAEIKRVLRAAEQGDQLHLFTDALGASEEIA